MILTECVRSFGIRSLQLGMLVGIMARILRAFV